MTTLPHRSQRFRLGPARLSLAVLALLVIVLAWWGVLRAERGLVSRDLVGAGGTPVRYLAPAGATGAPGVVIAHGFAGSRPLMLGFGYSLARAGYGVALLDFDGHGRAGGHLERSGDGLQRNIDTAYAALIAQPEIDPARVALLGHSMGSGAVMSAAIAGPDRYRATVAVSPTGADVSPDAPRNLLLMAGTLEPNFLGNGRALLALAGGENDDLAGGRGRALVEIPNVEHITILFSGRSHQAALDWLNRVFERPATTAAPDRRVFFYAAHIAGWLLLLVAVAPLIPAATPAAEESRGPWRRRWRWLGLPVGALAAVALLALLARLGDISELGGLRIGGALAAWFLALGLVWLIGGFRVPRPTAGDLLWGLVLFAALSLAFGLMADRVWLSWALIPARLARWLPVAAATLPWLLAAGLAQQGASPARRAGWWLFQTIVIVAGLALTIVLVPALGFMALIMSIIPLVLALMGIAGAAFDRPWSYALGNALFLGWLLVAVFPLA